MTRFHRVLLPIVLLLPTCCPAQTAEPEDANPKLKALLEQGTSLIHRERYDSALAVLHAAEAIDPKHPAVQYELGMVYFQQEQYRKALKIYKPLANNPRGHVQKWHILAKTYRQMGRERKARKTLERGLEDYPNAGLLHNEMGVLKLHDDELDAAIRWWEDGIQAEPSFPRNYYMLANLFALTNNKIWALIYGELFMNLERNTRRTRHMSRQLYDLYHKHIILRDTGAEINLARFQIALNEDEMNENEGEQPSLQQMFSPKLLFKLHVSTTLSSAAMDLLPRPENAETRADTLPTAGDIHRLRRNFLRRWFAGRHRELPDSLRPAEENISLTEAPHKGEIFPNVLFEWQFRMLKQGYLRSYDRWLLSQGDPAFKAWHEKNRTSFAVFVNWFNANPIPLSSQNHFRRSQYDEQPTEAMYTLPSLD